ncbi:diphosphate-dependent phosphofructokinase [Candidatus Magnetomoraceae bacterium gMMP-13]
MPNKKFNLNTLMNRPEVQKALDNESAETYQRRNFKPPLCKVFHSLFTDVHECLEFSFSTDLTARKELPEIIDNKVQIIVGMDSADQEFIDSYRRKRRIGIVFSGGPAPGGHNVISGLYDAAKKANSNTKIFGFLIGPDGIIENDAVELSDERVNKFRNLGGFTMIKTGRTKIDTDKKMRLSKETCKELKLDTLVIVGGDDSNTNAAFLAQEMFEDGIQVIGVPKTIDGDVQVRDDNGKVLCAMSFGFHSAARSFANQISNLATDGSSDVKYWHVCKVMGRVASHLALETALQTHANITPIGEDVVNYVYNERIKKAKKKGVIDYDAYGLTLRHLSRVICDGIVKRAAYGKSYGILILPEGILEFINEIQKFIIKLNAVIADYNNMHDNDFHRDFITIEDKLEYLRKIARLARENNTFSVWNTRDDDLFSDIPEFFRKDLLRERDTHGNFPFSMVETEKVIVGLVENYLDILKEKGKYKLGIKRSYYEKTLKKEGLDPDYFGQILFKNYEKDKFLLVKESIISLKTLKNTLIKENAIGKNDEIPQSVEKIYKKSEPKFKTQIHFYGYDGRGSEPTKFDCIYTYNLGYTIFSLIESKVTGQMAAIKNIEQDFSKWQPISIPLAPLMHLEERKRKLALVMEKSIIDVESPAFQTVKALREKWLAASEDEEDCFRKPPPIRFTGDTEEDRPITLLLNSIT